MLTRYSFVQDDDAHWYLIPIRKIYLYDDAKESGKREDWQEVERYRIAGGPQSYTFVDPLED